MRHLLSLSEIGPEDLDTLVKNSLEAVRWLEEGYKPLRGKTVGIYFPKTSTRTRTAFTIGAMKLGADTISFGPADLQTNTGETISDSARTLANYLEALVVRTNESMEEMRVWASQETMAVINALTEGEHPTQAIGDLSTIREALGRLDDIHLLFIGEGNSTAAALAQAVAHTPGMRLTLITPEGYGLPDELWEVAQKLAAQGGGQLEMHHSMKDLPKNVDAVYTTRWLTMGVAKKDQNWQERFDLYRVTPGIMAKVSKPSGTVFLHDLPAMRGHEVTDEVLDGPQSIAFRQAFHKLTSAMAAMVWCLGAEE